MPKIFSVDAALNDNQPYVEFRGRLYKLRDMTAAERIRRLIRFKEEQEEAVRAARAEAEDGEDAPDEDDFEHIQATCARALQEALEDIDPAVAASVTEREWEALQEAIKAARELTFPVEARDVGADAIDSKRVGRATG